MRVYPQSPDGDRKPKSPRPSATWVEVKHSILCFLLGHVAVPINDNRKSGGFGFQIQFRQVVQDVDRHALDFKHIGGRNLLRPCFPIHVAADRGNRRDLSQFFQDNWIADVAGVNDIVRPAQGG